MGWMCDRVVEAGGTVIADFICPTEQTRAVFGEAFTIWLDRIDTGRFADTNRMFVAPEKFDLRVGPDGTAQYWAEQALALLRPAFDPQKPTALFIGRYQPFHGGHQRLIEEGLRRVGQVCIAVRDTHGTDAKIRCRSSRSSSASKPRCPLIPGASWWCRCPTSPMSFTAATSATRSSASCSTRRPKRFPPPKSAA